MLSTSEKYEKIKEQCRKRQNRYYNKHRDTILSDRKLKKTKEIDECKCIFTLDKILSLLDETDKITNLNTLSCHKKRLISFFSITKIQNLETDLIDFNNISTLLENATYGKDNKLYKLNTKKNILESVDCRCTNYWFKDRRRNESFLYCLIGFLLHRYHFLCIIHLYLFFYIEYFTF